MEFTIRKPFATVIHFLAACAVAGCSNIRPPTSSAGETVRVEDKNYTLNQEKTVFVGESMLKRRDYYARHFTHNTSVSATKSGTISCKLVFLNPFIITFEAERLIKIEGEIEVDGVYCSIFQAPPLGVYPIILPSGKIHQEKMAESSPFGWRVKSVQKVEVTPADTLFLPRARDVVDSSKPFINYEIIYTGKSGGSMNLLYREFTPDDMAKSAFFQNLTYDVSSKTIRFRKIKIDVLEADNERIRFIVREDSTNKE